MQELASLDSNTFEPPKSRIGDGSQASSFAINLINADQVRAQQRAKVKGLVDGNAPFNRAEMVAKGMGSNCNLNFRQASAVINQFKTPYYDLVVEVPMLADIQTSFGKPTERSNWSQIISEEFHRMITGWHNWDFVVQFHQFQMLLHGVGICYFHDAVDWRPDVCKTGDVQVPDGSPSNLDELEMIQILKSYPSHALYRYIRNKEQATKLKWNVPATEKAIVESYSGSGHPPTDANSYEWYQQKLKNADLYFGTYESKDVKVAHQLVREFDDRVSHHIVRTDQATTDFLFSHVGRFESMHDVIVPFFYDIGDGTWHSIRGLGYEIYPYCETFNRLRCREVDGAMIASTVLLQQKSATTATKAQMLTLSNMGILPPDMEIASTNIGQGIEATVKVRQDMESGLSRNIGQMPAPGSINPRQGQKVTMMEMQQTASLGKGSINRYYTAFDKLYLQMFRRASSSSLKAFHPGAKEALEFQKRCMDRGVPREALDQIDSVKAMRSIGAGSAVNALMVTEAIMNQAGSLPEDGRQMAIRDWISRLAGGKFADRYMGEVATESYRTQDDSIAQLENDSLRHGGKCVITIEQSHIIHLKSHIGDAEADLQEFQEATARNGQQDIAGLQRLFIHMDAAGKHSAEHLEQLKGDKIRQSDFSELYKRWQQLARIQDQVRQQLEEAMQAQETEQAQAAPEQQDNTEFLSMLSKLYDKAPESVKAQIEQQLGTQRAEGELSVPAQKLKDSDMKTMLKAQGQQAKIAHDDVRLASELRSNQQPENDNRTIPETTR